MSDEQVCVVVVFVCSNDMQQNLQIIWNNLLNVICHSNWS